MKPVHDYFYRFPNTNFGIPGRCRVRIYKRKNGTHTVLLTELNSNAGESITSACERIATGLVSTKGLNPKTARWIQQETPQEDLPQVFDEVHFTWDSHNVASDPEWQSLASEQVEVLTGDDLEALSGQLGD